MTGGHCDWMNGAACRNHPHRRFWFGDFAAEVAVAVSVCRTCEVRRECLSHAIANSELLGVWGGTTERDRRRMIRTAQRQQRVAEATATARPA
jgi:WhiB family redox-sensing transcriptional regulator